MEKFIDNNEEIILCGDINIDTKALEYEENQKSQTQKAQNKLSTILKEKLIYKGLTILNSKDTFHIGNNYSSKLDIIMSNRLNKIKSTQTISDTESDHYAIITGRSMKISKSEESYIKIRNLKNSSQLELNNLIINNPKYKIAIESNNPDIICKNAINCINEAFDINSPEKKSKYLRNLKLILMK